jgi:regulator of cell morphogenesis and NO signaling
MTLNATMTVREVALESPNATRVFEKMKIDYCCGGNRSLAEACANAGLELESLEQMLNDAETDAQEKATIDFKSLTLTELITHILDKHHVYTKEEINRLTALIEKVIGAHGVNHPELHKIGAVFQRLCRDLEPHMFKEEQILFPYIIEMENAALNKRSAPGSRFGTVNNPIRMMMMEHDAVGDILRELRVLSSDYAVPADGCISYKTLFEALEVLEKDLHQHIHLENNILFPRAVEMEGSF